MLNILNILSPPIKFVFKCSYYYQCGHSTGEEATAISYVLDLIVFNTQEFNSPVVIVTSFARCRDVNKRMSKYPGSSESIGLQNCSYPADVNVIIFNIFTVE